VSGTSERAFELRFATPKAWLVHALAHFDEVLVDHAHCEKKAAANALSMLQTYPDVPGLPSKMARLAREEASHLSRVLALMEKRGLSLGRDLGDPYVHGLLALMRPGSKERRLDRLLVAALIEARSCERLELLSEGLEDAALKKFYAELATSEGGHLTLFVRLAEAVEPKAVVAARLDEMLSAEASLVERLPVRAAVH
jgi:tRNA-(ms[2]io[6]A)-hydroxylase